MFVQSMKSGASRRRGQGMTEYIIIVALVSIALITIVTLFGNKIKFLFTAATVSLEESKVTDPNKVFEEKSLKDKLGDGQVDKKKQSEASTLKNFKSGAD